MSENVSGLGCMDHNSKALNPGPPPFDPLATSNSVDISIGNSVVPDLMRVYESLTQSKTPDNPLQNLHEAKPPNSEAETTAHSTYKQETIRSAQHEEQGKISISLPNYAYNPETKEHSWFYEASNIPMSLPGDSQGPQAPSRRFMPPPPPPSQSQQSQNGRFLRKRSSSIIDESNHNEDENVYSSSGSVTSSRGDTKKGKGKKGKKDDKKEKDGRWSKRFTWPDELHRDFVAAIFDVGLKHSSPSTVMEHMAANEQITTERIKSHLQKYRLHRQKAKQEFMTDYEATMRKLKQSGYKGIDTLSGGNVAGHVAYSTMTNQSTTLTEDSALKPIDKSAVTASLVSSSTVTGKPEPESLITQTPQNPLMLNLPELTEDEKLSPIGASMRYLMGLFFSLKQQLDQQRQQKEHDLVSSSVVVTPTIPEKEAPQTVNPVHDSFSGGAESSQNLAVNTTTPSQTATVPHSTRSNLEQNSIMKQEMKNQMAFQNKMRALKQQELNKHKNQANFVMKVDPVDGSNPSRTQQSLPQSAYGQEATHPPVHYSLPLHTPIDTAPNHVFQQIQHPHQQPYLSHIDDHHDQNHPMYYQPGKLHDESHGTSTQQAYQGAGETAADAAAAESCGTNQLRNISIPVGDEDDFWNTDVVDEQLFQFLMDG